MATAAPAWCLVDRNGTQYKLPQAMIFLGREECDVNLKSRSVDPRHAVITFDHYDDVYKVKDLGSLNGTFVNEKRIPEEDYVPLNHLDTIRFGYDPMVYRIERVEESDACEIESILSQAAKIPSWVKREVPVVKGPECPGCIAEHRTLHHHTCADGSQPPPGHIHPTLVDYSKSGYYNSWPRQARNIPPGQSGPPPPPTMTDTHSHYQPDYHRHYPPHERGPPPGHLPPHHGSSVTYLPDIARSSHQHGYTHQQPYYQNEPMYVSTQHSGHYPVTQHTYSHVPTSEIPNIPTHSGQSSFHSTLPTVQTKFQHTDSLEKDNLEDEDSQCGQISESFARLAEYKSPEFGDVTLEGDVCNNNVITSQSERGSIPGSRSPMTPDSIGARQDGRRKSVPELTVDTVEANEQGGEDGLGTAKKCTPLYGQPAWWGEDDAEDYKYPKTASPKQGGAGESSSLDHSAERPSSLDVKTPAEEQATSSSGSVQQQEQPPPPKPPEGVSMAFTVEFDDVVSSKKFSMKDKLSKFVPNKMRKNFRDRQISKKEKDGSEEEKDLSPKDEEDGMRENRKRCGYSSDGNNASPSDEDVNIKSEIYSKDKRLKVMNRRSSAPPKPPKNSVLARLTKSKSATKQSSSTSNVSASGSSFVPDLIDKMITNKSKQKIESQSEMRVETKYESNSVTKTKTVNKKLNVSSITNNTSSKPPLQQKSPGFPSKRKPSFEITEEVVEEEVPITNGHKTDDQLLKVDNTDNVSEAGTYTIGEESKSKEVDHARQNIDVVFGLADKGDHIDRRPSVDDDSGSNVSDRILDDDFDETQEDNMNKMNGKRYPFQASDSLDVEIGSSASYGEREDNTHEGQESSHISFKGQNKRRSEGISKAAAKSGGRKLPSIPGPDGNKKGHEQSERMPPDGSSPKHRSLERLDVINHEENMVHSSEQIHEKSLKFKHSKSAEFSTATWTKKGARIVEIDTGTWNKSTLKSMKKEYHENDSKSPRSSSDSNRFGFRHARTGSDSQTCEDYIDDALKLHVDDEQANLSENLNQSPQLSRKHYDNCDSRVCDEYESDASSAYAGEEISPRQVALRTVDSSKKKPAYSPKSIRKISSGRGPSLKKEMTAKEKVLLHLNNQSGKRGSLPAKMDPSCMQQHQYAESADGYSETTSNVSDISDTCMSDVCGFNRVGSGGKGKMSMTRPNRAFALRRARLEAEADAMASAKKPSNKSSVATTKTTMTSRTANRSISMTEGHNKYGSRTTKKANESPGSGNFSRTDGGRYSLRSARGSSLGAETRTVESRSRTSTLGASRSSTSLITPTKSTVNKSKPNAASSSQPNSRSNSPKSAEKTAWLRRKEYDPRKAAADAKKAAAAKKKGPKIVKPVDRAQSEERGPPVRRIRKDTYTSSNEDLSLSLDSTREDYEGELFEEGAQCKDKIAKISSELAKDLHSLASGFDEHGNYISPQTEFKTEELLASMLKTTTSSSAFQSPRSSKSNTPCSQLCTCPSTIVARRRYRNRTPMSDQEDYSSTPREKTYDSLFVTSIQFMSSKLRESTQGLISKLRESEVLNESPIQDLPDEQSENELPGYKSADQDLAAILKNLRIVEKHVQAIDGSLFPESPGHGSTIEVSSDDQEYRRRVEQLSDFKPIDQPGSSKSWSSTHHQKQKSSDSSAADFEGEEYF